MALLVGELKSVLSIDTSGFDKGLSSSEAKFKGASKKLDATSREVAKKAGDGLGGVNVAAAKASDGIEKMSISQGRAALAQDKHTAAVKKYGAGSLQARTASLSMRSAQENLARSNKKASDSTDDADRSMGGFSQGAGTAGLAAVGVGAAVIAAGMKITDYAGKLDLLKKKSATVFGGEIGRVQSWAAANAHAMGLTKGEATGLAAGLGDLLIPMGFTRKAAADMSTATVGLSGALAEWSGGTKSAAEVTDILSAAFMGERDGLNALGISITQAEVDAALLAAGQQDLTGKQLQQAEAMATQKLIMEKSTDAQKAFAEGSGSLARQSAETRARLKEMGETIATKAAPSLLKIATFVNEDVIPALSKAGGVAKKFLDTLNNLPAPVKAGGLTLIGFSIAAAGVASLVGKVTTGISGLKEAFTGLSSKGKYLTLSLGAVGLALAAAAAIYSIFAARQAEAKQKVEDLRGTLDEQTGAITGNTRAYVANKLAQNGMLEKAKEFGLSLTDVTNAALGNQAAMDAVGTTLNRVIDQNALLSNGEVSGELIVQSKSAQQLKDEIFGLSGGLSEAQKQQKLVGEATKESSAATGAQATTAQQATAALALKAAADQKAAEAAAAHEKEVNDQIAAMLKMPGLVLSLRDAQRGWQAAVDSASASLKENGKTLDNTTPKGRANQEALDGMADSANDVTKSMIENGQSNLSVVRTYEQNRAGLIRTAIQFGLNRKEAEKYAAKVLAIPPRSNTTLKADVTDLQAKLKTAKSKLNDKDLTKERRAKLNADIKKLEAAVVTAQRKVNGLKGKKVPVEVKFTSLGYTLALGKATEKQKFAAGGGVFGGERGKDSVPALLMPDEHVWTTEETAAVGGHGAMKRLRNAALAGNLRGFAKGGSPNSSIDSLLSRVIDRTALQLKVGFGPYGSAMGFAQSQAGKPYGWGSAGPGSYDCSGFMGAITNYIRGKSPYSRVGSTGTFPWSGFARGAGAFMIGSRTGNPGHMAGTLMGMNVESRGGEGVVVGPRARGATNGLFGGNVWHLARLALGGRAGDAPFDLLNSRGRHFDRGLRELLGYESGTSYVPRDGLAYLHQGERVVNADENSGKQPMTVQMDEATLRSLAVAMIRAARETPIVMDGRRLDEVFTQRAMSGGYV